MEAAQRRNHRRSVEPILALLLETRPHAEDLVSRAGRDDGLTTADLDPLAALLPYHIGHWYQELGGPFRLLHDEHPLLQPQFVQEMLHVLWAPHPSLADLRPRARLAVFATGTSIAHSSIQLADLAAGAGRVVVAAHLGQPSQPADILAESVTPLITWGLLPDDSFWEPRRASAAARR